MEISKIGDKVRVKNLQEIPRKRPVEEDDSVGDCVRPDRKSVAEKKEHKKSSKHGVSPKYKHTDGKNDVPVLPKKYPIEKTNQVGFGYCISRNRD